jgi:predicted nucleotidyltransferase
VAPTINHIHETRAKYSEMRLKELRERFAQLHELANFPDLPVFCAGSYARLEASEFSDIDMFFLTSKEKKDVEEPRTKSLRLFGKVIETVHTMHFPKFSNDCEYLVLLHTKDILSNLGGRIDDHENYFTARMLLLLESYCLHGSKIYDEITEKIVNSYFKDFPDHQHTFQPMFLLNDVCRFWKTLLLNYENKRNAPPGMVNDENRRTKQRVRNFKLKYSRMTTCFASVAALGSYLAPVTEKQVIEMIKLSPRRRLESVADRSPAAKEAVSDVLQKYDWFLEMTGLQTEELEGHFSDKQKRTEMFQNANNYGDAMFKLLQVIDSTDSRLRLLRNLVI